VSVRAAVVVDGRNCAVQLTMIARTRFVDGIVARFLLRTGRSWVGLAVRRLDGANENPPGLQHALYAIPGSQLILAASYAFAPPPLMTGWLRR
jgi:hypothetical protein